MRSSGSSGPRPAGKGKGKQQPANEAGDGAVYQPAGGVRLDEGDVDSDFRNRGRDRDQGRGNGERQPRMDAGLAKCCCPDATDLWNDACHIFSGKTTVFQRLCHRRGDAVVSEGARLPLQALQGDAWGACESIGFERMGAKEAFDDIFGELDALYRYAQEVEFPVRGDAFFGEFSSLPKEAVNARVLRHGQELSKLREAGLGLPSLLAGRRVMARSAIPRWQIPNLKTLCNNELTVQ
ncbi:unnamed protein product, partial [Prorocentrum cordatum]